MEVDSLDDHWRIKDSLEPTVHRMMLLDSNGLEKLLVVLSDHGTTTRAEDIYIYIYRSVLIELESILGGSLGR
jgi:hypothetical protein